MKGAYISVYWPDDWKTVRLTPRNWRRVLAGKSLYVRGKGYYYDGEFYRDYWSFNDEGKEKGSVTVYYGDDGGTGFSGSIDDLEIEEFEYIPKRRKKFKSVLKGKIIPEICSYLN